MYLETDYEELAKMIKSNPLIEAYIRDIIDENKKNTSMLIHELRNPLSLIKGTIQYIESKYPETKGFKYWSELNSLVLELENMMSDASRLNACSTINKEFTDLIALSETIRNNFMPQAMNQQIDLKLIIQPGCELYFSSYPCDSVKMIQVISNLVKNAFEATSPGNYISIVLNILPSEAGVPSMLSIQVNDNGLPIPEDEIGTIFLPFVTYKKGGTGVGLAIAKRIIELHYGSISVSSDKDQTSFTILLPLYA